MKPHRSNAKLWLGAPLAALVVLMALCAGPSWAKKKDPKPPAAAPSKGDEKPFDDVVKDMEVQEGLFRIYRDREENRMLIELMPDQLERTFIWSSSVDQSVGERGFYAAQVLSSAPTEFQRIGKTIHWIQRNTLHLGEEGAPSGRSTARSFAHAILASAKIASKPHPDRKSILVNASELFGSDLPGFAPALGRTYRPTIYRFDKDRSGPLRASVFPKNVVFDVRLHYTTDDPKAFSATLPDPRSVPVVVKYDLSALEPSDYKPRRADDRIGHFHEVQQDFRSDHAADPYVRNIQRWHLVKADSSQALSPPKAPIVYWLENTIPVEYREAVTEGVLLWNTAFERIGFKDAIVVKQQPDSADWDAADARYSTIRWFDAVDATFAIGPRRANPHTGQIYDADVSIAGGYTRVIRRFGEEFIGPSSQELSNWLGDRWGRDPGALCSYGSGLADQAAFGASVLEARGSISPEMEKKLMHQFVAELVAHEVGHTLGLRHNFRGTSILSPAELGDVNKTREVGQSGSVMDYNPFIIARKGEPQGDFVPTTLGTYDHWAIEYAYKPIEGDESAELARIASRAASDPTLPYSTDEDALGTYSARSIDPLANQYDQSNDPLGYFKTRVEIVEELWRSLDTKVVQPGDGYQAARRALGSGLREYNRALLTSSKMVGGIYHHRDHAGDPGARAPYVPVAADKQREALAFLAERAFGDRSFQLPASILNRLAIDRLPAFDWQGYVGATRLDYPWHDAVLGMQQRVLSRLYDPVTLGRILDNEMRFGPGETPFRMVDLFSGISSAIWTEVDKPAGGISSLRRNLQREHVRQLVTLLLRHPAEDAPSPPEDATTLARASLTRIRERIKSALASPSLTDLTSRLHLQETDARVSAALNAGLDLGLD